MPELAEVALYARDLSNILKDQILLDCHFPNQRDWGSVIAPRRIQEKFKNARHRGLRFKSLGKGLQIFSEGTIEPLCEFRLGMTGSFSLQSPRAPFRRHCFVHLKFKNINVYYSDPRRFGRIEDPRDNLYSLGGMTLAGKINLTRRINPPQGYLTRKRIAWLLGTGHLTGVGNYMANEALGRLNLSPFEFCTSKEEAIKILKMCQRIAKESIKCGGNSFATGYFSLFGKEGNYIKKCEYYGNSLIPRSIHGGRPVFSLFQI